MAGLDRARLGTVRGQVFKRRTDGRVLPFKSALLTIVNVETGRSSERRLTDSKFEFQLPAGKWSLVASSANAKSNRSNIRLAARGRSTVKLVIR